jgi:hypothetical protein
MQERDRSAGGNCDGTKLIPRKLIAAEQRVGNVIGRLVALGVTQRRQMLL